MREWGIALLIGAFLTLIAYMACPSLVVDGVGHLVEGPVPGSRHSVSYELLDLATFVAWECVIWPVVVGLCLLWKAGVFKRAIPTVAPTHLSEIPTWPSLPKVDENKQ